MKVKMILNALHESATGLAESNRHEQNALRVDIIVVYAQRYRYGHGTHSCRP